MHKKGLGYSMRSQKRGFLPRYRALFHFSNIKQQWQGGVNSEIRVLATFGDSLQCDRVGNSRIAPNFPPIPPSLPACDQKIQPLKVKVAISLSVSKI